MGTCVSVNTKSRLHARNAAIIGGYVNLETFKWTKLDRNQAAKLMHTVAAMERATKRHGCPNGVVGRPAVEVLRALLYKFADRATGKCFPSIAAIAEATNYCRRTVVTALQMLEMVGVLAITRRLVRTPQGCRQGSNVYRFLELGRHIVLPERLTPAKPRPFFRASVQEMTRKATQMVFSWKEGESFASSQQLVDWRERARAIIGR